MPPQTPLQARRQPLGRAPEPVAQAAKVAPAPAEHVRHHTPIMPMFWHGICFLFREAAICVVVLVTATGAGFLAHVGLTAERNGVAFDSMLLVDMLAPDTGISMAANSAILTKLPEGQPPIQTIASHLIAGMAAYIILTGARLLLGSRRA